MIDQNIDLKKLACPLKDYVHDLKWYIQSIDSEKQKAAPLNAILDQLASKNDNFDAVHISKKLLLKSNWVGRLGGRALVEARDGNLINIFKTRTGLKMLDEDGEESEDDE